MYKKWKAAGHTIRSVMLTYAEFPTPLSKAWARGVLDGFIADTVDFWLSVDPRDIKMLQRRYALEMAIGTELPRYTLRVCWDGEDGLIVEDINKSETRVYVGKINLTILGPALTWLDIDIFKEL